ncbi:MAG TPA: hypothetical protein VIN40_02155 [Candidatus Tyrphobacter sp.]
MKRVLASLLASAFLTTGVAMASMATPKPKPHATTHAMASHHATPKPKATTKPKATPKPMTHHMATPKPKATHKP